MSDAPMINVGGANKDSVEEMKKALDKILSSNNDKMVKMMAIDCLQKACSVENTMISNCYFTNNEEKGGKK